MKKPPPPTASARGAPRSEGSENKHQKSNTDLGITAQEQLANGGIHVASFWKSPRNRREAIQVSLKSYEGHPYLDARVYAMDVFGRMQPTHKGIAVGCKMLPQFSKAIGDGLRRA